MPSNSYSCPKKKKKNNLQIFVKAEMQEDSNNFIKK